MLIFAYYFNSIKFQMILLDQNDFDNFLENLAQIVIERALTQGQELDLDTAKDLVFQFIHQGCKKNEVNI